MGSVWWASILLHCLVKHVCCCTPASAQCSIPAAVDMLPFKSIVVPNNVPVVFFSATFAVSSTTNGVSFNLCLLKSAKQESPAILKIVIKRQDPVSWNIVIIINHPLQLIDPIIALLQFSADGRLVWLGVVDIVQLLLDTR
uniref:Uncharacterized protein n=1 Tax=Rhodnius prolixus TaxID=13249 RepID=T1HHJ8_RHOPR